MHLTTTTSRALREVYYSYAIIIIALCVIIGRLRPQSNYAGIRRPRLRRDEGMCDYQHSPKTASLVGHLVTN